MGGGHLRAVVHNASVRAWSAQKDVVSNAHRANERKLLIDDGYTQFVCVKCRLGSVRLTLNPNFSLEVGMRTGQDLDQRAFACAVLTGQSMHLAGTEIEIHVVENRHTTKSLGDATHFDEQGQVG